MAKCASSFSAHQNKFELSSFTLMWMHKPPKVHWWTQTKRIFLFIYSPWKNWTKQLNFILYLHLDITYLFVGTASHIEYKCLFHSSSKFEWHFHCHHIVVQVQSHNLVLLINQLSFRSTSRKHENCRQLLPNLKRQGQEVTENDLFINCYHIVCYNNDYYCHHHYCSNLANFAETSPSDDKEREWQTIKLDNCEAKETVLFI